MGINYAKPRPTDGIPLEQLDSYLQQHALPPKYELWTIEQHRYPRGQVSFDRTVLVYKADKEWRYARVATWPVGRVVGKKASRRALETDLDALMYEPVHVHALTG